MRPVGWHGLQEVVPGGKPWPVEVGAVPVEQRGKDHLLALDAEVRRAGGKLTQRLIEFGIDVFSGEGPAAQARARDRRAVEPDVDARIEFMRLDLCLCCVSFA